MDGLRKEEGVMPNNFDNFNDQTKIYKCIKKTAFICKKSNEKII